MPKRIGWVFRLGHGHTAQFLNFQECWPADVDVQPHWFGLDGSDSSDPLSKLPFVPAGIRHRRNEMWNAHEKIDAYTDWSCLFFASENTRLISFLRRYPSFLYTDLTPSLKTELSPWYDHMKSKHWAVQKLKDALHARTYRAAKGIFTMSHWAARGVIRDYHVPERKVHVTLPGANLKRWHWVDRSGREGRPVRILMVGGQFRLKGGELLLNWAEHTKLGNWELDVVTWPQELPDWARQILGNPQGSEAVSRSLAPRLPNVRVHCGVRPNSDQMLGLFRDADVFCLPTQADGSSIASLEAMATGLPVLVGAAGGIPELIEEGRTGMLLTRGSQQALNTALEAVLADAALRRKMGKAAREACEKHLNVERQLREMLAKMGV